MSTISVIVPVYKVEAYLDRCVKSILEQTFTDFELILVDDGSPDNCGAMCDVWAAKDSRIKVIHKKNGGLSDARNAGFAASESEWIAFVDSDDYVHPAMLQALYDAVQVHDVKISACGYTKTNGEPLEKAVDLTARLWSAEEFFMQRNINATVAWGKLYHRNVVLPYPVGKLHEDEFVTYRILFGCQQIAVLDAALYGYYHNPTGIMNSDWNPKRLDKLEALHNQMTFFYEYGHTVVYRQAIYRYLKMIGTDILEIDNLPHGDRYSVQRKLLVKNGRKHFWKYCHERVFDWYADGYFLQPLFPSLVKLYAIYQVGCTKLKGK